jgi:cytochrome P450 family 4
MCGILQHRHFKLWLRPDWLFSLTSYGKEQINLLGIIHGLTKEVNAVCLCIFTKRISLIVL